MALALLAREGWRLHCCRESFCLHVMKRIIIVILIILPLASIAEEDFLSSFVQGSYLLVGKGLDSEQTYHGKVQIKNNNGALKIVRYINGKTIDATGAIEPALNGDARVLRIRFTENEKLYEQTCLVDSDLDNYARISCYLYQPEAKTNQPGLEVLFNDHNPE